MVVPTENIEGVADSGIPASPMDSQALTQPPVAAGAEDHRGWSSYDSAQSSPIEESDSLEMGILSNQTAGVALKVLRLRESLNQT